MRSRLVAALTATIGAGISGWALLAFAGADLANIAVMTLAIFIAVFYFAGRRSSADR